MGIFVGMLSLSCPSCGGNITFNNSASVSAVCPYCRATVVRKDMNLENLGKMAELPQDMSPIQLSTQGKWERRHFTVVGRLKQGWKDGVWNEWFLFFEDGTQGWLAEAQGFWMISFADDKIEPPAAKQVRLGSKWELRDGLTAKVTDIKQYQTIAAEGELPFSNVLGQRGISVDLQGGKGVFVTLSYPDGEAAQAYRGVYAPFTAFQFSNLRELDGWRAPRPQA